MASRIVAARAGFDRPLFIGPSLPATIEDSGIVESEQAKQPPDPRRPPDAAGAVDDHARMIANAETLDRARKILRARRGEVQMAVVVGEVGLQIDELRAGDVTLLEFRAFRDDTVGLAGLTNDVGRRVEDAEIRIVEVCGEPLGVDQ